jgi:hypothetical protein
LKKYKKNSNQKNENQNWKQKLNEINWWEMKLKKNQENDKKNKKITIKRMRTKLDIKNKWNIIPMEEIEK